MIYRGIKIAAASKNLTSALKQVLALICELTQSSVGHVYLPDADDKFMSAANVWTFLNSKHAGEFKELSKNLALKRGSSLVGRVWDSKSALWMVDIAQRADFPFARVCAKIKLNYAFGFPIIVNARVIAICEFFTQFYHEQHEDVVRILGLLGVEISYGLEHSLAVLKLEKLAHFDMLTRLANRSYFYDKLKLMIQQSAVAHKKFALLYLDIDDFRNINDSFGHDVGDKLLERVASIIRAAIKSTDFTARIGGDEFAILVRDEGELLRDVTYLTQHIITNIKVPYYADNHELNSSASIGVTLYPVGGLDASILMKNADLAMYRAKASGKDTCYFFSNEFNLECKKQMLIEVELRHAMKRQEFYLVYQPQFSLLTGKIYGFEALLRWNSPHFAAIGAAEFIVIAERTGLIFDIGSWVLREACRQYQLWGDQYSWFKAMDLMLSINLSALQLARSDIVAILTQLIRSLKFKPAQLMLEITETAIIRHLNVSITILEAIHELGIGVAIDDFGSGYSSLSQLKMLPVDALKIDQSFIADVVKDADSAAIMQAIIQLGAVLGLTIIAEVVETAKQLNFLKQTVCHCGQGYYLSHPLLEGELIKLLQKQHP